MSQWVAVSYGALDIRDHELANGTYDLLVTPTIPGEPLMLLGAGSTLWRRLVDSPLADDELSEDDRDIVRDMERMGIASRRLDHRARVEHLSSPWLTSPLHELVYSLLYHVADSLGIRLVFIKGPTLHAQGLRERAHSGDVDCWVEPGAEMQFARAMKEWGWDPASSAFTGTRVLHSLTLRASEWGCAVDVHSWFPGISATPSKAFEVLHAASEQREFAGFSVRTPPKDLHAVIAALNEVRPWRGNIAAAAQIERAANILREAGDETIRATERVGAEYALSDPMKSAFPSRRLDHHDAVPPLDWRWRMQRTPLRVYLAALSIVAPHERLRVLFRVIWPTADSLRSGPVPRSTSTLGRYTLRLRRWGIGLKQIRDREIR